MEQDAGERELRKLRPSVSWFFSLHSRVRLKILTLDFRKQLDTTTARESEELDFVLLFHFAIG